MSRKSLLLNSDAPWIISPEEPEPVRRALQDLQNDWYSVMGRLPLILAEPPDWDAGPVLYLGTASESLLSTIGEMPTGPEGFLLRVQKDANDRDCIVATGVDMRGIIYSLYAFSEHVLGFDPWYFWIDKRPSYQGTLEVPQSLNLFEGPSTFRWRGWFMNDEDLLNGFAPDPMRENVFSLDISDKIYETLLRLRGNMVAPATFPFPDERCLELAHRRGLVLHMHHLLTLGLNTSRWPPELPFSYTRHPEIIEAHWKTCVDVLKDKEVLWAVGFRGKQDRPFWIDDTDCADLSEAEKGSIISKAIAKQAQLVRNVQPDAPMVANLFMEGNALYRAGHIQLPEGVVPVWADLGNGVVGDYGTVKKGDGVYYHTAMMNNRTNQLTEMVGPERIFRELGRFVQNGATEYLLLNLSDVRPVPLTSDCVMSFIRNAKPWMQKSSTEAECDFLVDWCKRSLDPTFAVELGKLYQRYFSADYMREEETTRGEHYFCSWILNFHTRCFLPLVSNGNDPFARFGEILTARVLFPTPQNSTLIDGGSPAEGIAFAAYAIDHFGLLVQDIEALLPKISESRRTFFRTHLYLQAKIHFLFALLMKSYASGIIALAGKRSDQAKAHFSDGLDIIEKVCSILREGEGGCWHGWYRGEKFVAFEAVRDFLRQTIAMIEGKPFPLCRRRTRYESTPFAGKRRIRDEVFSQSMRWDIILDYQNAFTQNFPLLYPKKD